jgi:hypothetical protein
MAKLSSAEILDAFASMSVLELSEFKKAFEEKFGVTAAAPVAMMAAGPAAAAPAAAAAGRAPARTGRQTVARGGVRGRARRGGSVARAMGATKPHAGAQGRGARARTRASHDAGNSEA